MNDRLKVIADFLADTKDIVRRKELAYRLVMNGNVWDYTQHPEDIIRWWNKIRAEDEEARLEVEFATYEEMYRWKAGD